MILMIDNYDSFTYNLYQLIGSINEDIQVYRNDKITIEEIEELNPTHIIVSPGPKYPKDAGISVEAIKHFSGKIPILGVCLGHQSIGEAFGANIIRAKEILHGKTSLISVDNTNLLFKGFTDEVVVGRYHSLVIERQSFPKELKVIAEDKEGAIMAVCHNTHKTYGVQFHPESILTPEGKKIIENFLEVEAYEQ